MYNSDNDHKHYVTGGEGRLMVMKNRFMNKLYADRVSKLARKRSEEVFPNHNYENANAIVINILEQALVDCENGNLQNNLEIVSTKMKNYDSIKQTLERLASAMAANTDKEYEIRIIVKDKPTERKLSEEISKINAKLDTNRGIIRLKYVNCNEAYKEDFIVVDNMWRFEYDTEKYQARASFNESQYARLLRRYFGMLWNMRTS